MDKIERDCSTCTFHSQGAPMDHFCMDCLDDPTLPAWEPKVHLEEAYYAALDERYPVEGDHGIGGIMWAHESTPTPAEQSRKESLLESLLNTLSGFVVSYLVWMLVAAPLFNIPVNHTETFWITCLFTAVSVVRSYVWRRLFVNKFWRKLNET